MKRSALQAELDPAGNAQKKREAPNDVPDEEVRAAIAQENLQKYD